MSITTKQLIVLCDECWEKKYPKRKPFRVPNPPEATCDNCAKPTRSGIYVNIKPQVDAAE